MTTMELLLVRACKSLNPHKRLDTLLKRFYIRDYHPGLPISLLGDICDKYKLVTVYDIIQKLSPKFYLFLLPNGVEPNSYDTRCLNALVSIVRLSEVDKFPGYVKKNNRHRT
jgi:hypothetical protein